MTLNKFLQEICNDDYIILSEKGDKIELSPLILKCSIIDINFSNETVYITIK